MSTDSSLPVKGAESISKPKFNQEDYNEFLDQLKREFIRHFEKKSAGPTVELKDFDKLRTLGTGSFGRVVCIISITSELRGKYVFCIVLRFW